MPTDSEYAEEPPRPAPRWCYNCRGELVNPKASMDKIEQLVAKWVNHYPVGADLAGKIEHNLRYLNHVERAVQNDLNDQMCIEGADTLGLVKEAAGVMHNLRDIANDTRKRIDRIVAYLEDGGPGDPAWQAIVLKIAKGGAWA